MPKSTNNDINYNNLYYTYNYPSYGQFQLANNGGYGGSYSQDKTNKVIFNNFGIVFSRY
jgi:hypothetical protein